MKLSAFHKAQGDSVSWFDPLFCDADKVYSSKVFTFSAPSGYLPQSAVRGGTGNDLAITLPDAIEHAMPDYSLYSMDYSMGFVTRGCPRKCAHCFVPDKEGDIRANADVSEFLAHKKLVLMDNNILAHPHGIEQIEKIVSLGVAVDFNQGLDARLIDDQTARLLSKLKWLAPLRLACDSPAMIEPVRKAVEHLRWQNVTPSRYFCYVLVKDVPQAVEVVRALKGMNVDPFCQPYRDVKGTEPTDEQKAFARWTCMKAEYKSRCWEDYRKSLNLASPTPPRPISSPPHTPPAPFLVPCRPPGNTDKG
jgi:hypothetical protein